jgi:hypothetical protein
VPARNRVTTRELNRYFQNWLDTGFRHGLMNRYERQATLDGMREVLPEVVRSLNSSGNAEIPLGGGTGLILYLRDGIDPDHGRFNLFEIQPPGRKRPRRLRCFLGQRFGLRTTDALRMNLRYVLEPSNVELIWSDMDMSAEAFFSKTVKEIEKADFCIFDNRGADEKPNVYIEAGIAYVRRKPFIMANYLGNRMQVPSDLTHINSVAYKSYADLMQQIYFRLPVFLKDNRLHKKQR